MALKEEKILPFFLLLCIVLQVTAVCTKSWLDIYYGDVLVTRVTPWYLCDLTCLQCTRHKPSMTCFWDPDWVETGFETLSVIQHLEYWTLGALILALFPAVTTCLGTSCRSKSCSIDCSKSTVILIFTSSLLSTVSVSLFGSKYHVPLDMVTTYKDVQPQLGSSFYCRIVAAVLSWTVAVLALARECRVKVQANETENRLMVVTSAREMILEDSCDDNEDGALL